MPSHSPLDCDQVFELVTAGPSLSSPTQAGGSLPTEALAHLQACTECREFVEAVLPVQHWLQSALQESSEALESRLSIRSSSGQLTGVAQPQAPVTASLPTQPQRGTRIPARAVPSQLRERAFAWGSPTHLFSSFGVALALLLFCVGGAVWLQQSSSTPTPGAAGSSSDRSTWQPIATGVPSAAGYQRLVSLGAPASCLSHHPGDLTQPAWVGESREPQQQNQVAAAPPPVEPQQPTPPFQCCTTCHHESSSVTSRSLQVAAMVGQSCAICHVSPSP